MTGQVSPALTFLADAVRERREKQLGLSRAAVVEAGGPSLATLNRIENPRPDTFTPRASTLRLLDQALQWHPGSARGCLEFQDPIPLEERAVRAVPDVDMLDVIAEVAGPADALTDPARTNGGSVGDIESVSVPSDFFLQFFALVDEYRKEGDNPRFAAGLDAIAQQLGAVHATEVLERWGGPGRTVPQYLGMSLRPYIVPGASFQAADGKRYYFADQDYRRWLAGLEDDTPDQKFRRRWAWKNRSSHTRD